jgi:hypothetical protein
VQGQQEHDRFLRAVSDTDSASTSAVYLGGTIEYRIHTIIHAAPSSPRSSHLDRSPTASLSSTSWRTNSHLTGRGSYP